MQGEDPGHVPAIEGIVAAGATLILEAAVPAPSQVVIPALLFQERRDGFRTRAVGAHGAPQVTKVIARMAQLLLPVSGGGHA